MSENKTNNNEKAPRVKFQGGRELPAATPTKNSAPNNNNNQNKK